MMGQIHMEDGTVLETFGTYVTARTSVNVMGKGKKLMVDSSKYLSHAEARMYAAHIVQAVEQQEQLDGPPTRTHVIVCDE